MKIGFIGAGKMAEAVISSVLKARLCDAHELSASDVVPVRRRQLKSRYGINMYSKNRAVATSVEILFLCVKPQDLDAVLSEIAADVTRNHLVVSIAAGKKLKGIESRIPNSRVVRVMPNLACMVGQGMSCFCLGKKAGGKDRKTITDLFSCLGKVAELPEDQFDAITALSGSGPAFLSYFLNEMLDAGVAEGLSKEDALMLAEQTMLGTALYLREKRTDPASLIEAVASAKGTTAAGLKVLRKSAVSRTIHRMIAAAAERSRELSS